MERVANKYLEHVDIEDEQKEETVHICKYFHTSAANLSEKYVWFWYSFITPLSYFSNSLSECSVAWYFSHFLRKFFHKRQIHILSLFLFLCAMFINQKTNCHWINYVGFRFYNTLGRKTYVTPTSYLELITAFKTLINKKQDETMKAKKRYVTGLEQLKFAGTQVGVNMDMP